MHFHALLVEGIAGVGKSTVIDGLLRRHVAEAGPRRVRSFLHLAQTHTYGPLAPAEDDGTLTVEQNQRHLDRIAGLLEWLAEGVRAPGSRDCFALVDTLHLTHCVRPGVVRWEDVAAVDRRLADAGCRLLVLAASPEVIRRRAVDPRAGTPFLREYGRKLGRTPEELHAYFVREQETLLTLFDRSVMAKLLLSNDGEADEAVARAYAFWKGV